MDEQRSAPEGAILLRALRERVGKSQLLVEVEAELGSGYLQRVERGKVQQPERATLERILTALGAVYSERRTILEHYGYATRTDLPGAQEQAWACSVCRDELHGVAFPAYMVDCAQRVLAWNRSVPPLLGLSGSAAQGQLHSSSLIELWFDPARPGARRILEPERFYPQAARALRHELLPYRHEPWYQNLIAHSLADLPLFRRYWSQQSAAGYAVAARALIPYRLAEPAGGALLFRVSSEPFTHDARFRIVYFLPADTATIRACLRWSNQAESDHTRPDSS
jgi:transcriptional regulator with XRE-family HTH domain